MRLFAAIELEAGIKQGLVRLQRDLRIAPAAVRWLTPDQMHLTLKFLGDVPDPDVPVVCEALREIAGRTPPFEIEVAGLGCFPPGGSARIVWAGLNEPTGVLALCRERCEAAFADLGFRRENRGFTPHLTIGRVKEPRASHEIRAAVQRHVAFQGGRQDVAEIVMFESFLKREGAEYAAVARYALGEQSM
jgi:2'-5' RNA ligase